MGSLLEEKKRDIETIQMNLRNEIDCIINEESIKIEKDIDSVNAADFSSILNGIFGSFGSRTREDTSEIITREDIFDRFFNNINKRVKNKIEEEVSSLIKDFLMRFEILAPSLNTEIKDIYSEKEIPDDRGFLEKAINFLSFDMFFQRICKIRRKIGDNRHEVINENCKILKEYYHKEIDNVKKMIEEDLLSPYETMIHRLDEQVSILENQLQDFKEKIKESEKDYQYT